MNLSQHRIEWAGAPQFFPGCVPGWGQPGVLVPLSVQLPKDGVLDFIQLDGQIQSLLQGMAIEGLGKGQTSKAQLLERLQIWTWALLRHAGYPHPKLSDLVGAISIKPGVDGLVLACPLQAHHAAMAALQWLVRAVNHALAGEPLAAVAEQLPSSCRR